MKGLLTIFITSTNLSLRSLYIRLEITSSKDLAACAPLKHGRGRQKTLPVSKKSRPLKPTLGACWSLTKMVNLADTTNSFPGERCPQLSPGPAYENNKVQCDTLKAPH